MAKCKSCALKQFKAVPWQLVDNPQYPVLFIGRNPGAVECVTKIPFTGPAGKMLWRLMKEAGLDKRNLNLTNLVACPTEGDREPTQEEVDNCHERLKKEINYLKPELIVALGQQASDALVGPVGSIGKTRGNFYQILPLWNHDCKVLLNYHPSFIQRSRAYIEEAIRDLKKVVVFFKPDLEVVYESPNFNLDANYRELQEYLGFGGATAFDIETTGLNPRLDKILGISFSNTKNSAVACYLKEGDNRLDVIKRFLEDPTVEKCTQNGLFDLSFLERNSITVKGLTFDTHLAQKMLNPDLPADLNFLRQQFTEVKPYKPSNKEIKNAFNIPKEKLQTFNCWDSLTTFLVMEEQKLKLSEKEKFLINDLLLPLIPCLNQMEDKGLLVDINTLALLYAKLLPLEEELSEEFKPIGLNPGSPVQICKYFGLKDSGEDTLNYLIKRQDTNSKWFQKILDFRSYQKAIGTYLIGVKQRLEDGRIHTKFKFGTGTGRLASENPNLQNVPDPLRVIYIPDSEDYVFVSLDFKQLELRVLGLVAKILSLLEDLKNGVDPHEELRKIIYSEGRESITPKDRQRLITKAALFGTVYGRTKRSLGIEFGVSDDVAESWQLSCVYKYPEVPNYWRRTQMQIATKGYVETPFGRRRYNLDSRQGYNTPIQSTAADVNNYTLLKLFRKGFDMRLTVHDDNIFQVHKYCLKDALKESVNIAEEYFKELDYSFTVKPKVGENWRDLEEVNL